MFRTCFLGLALLPAVIGAALVAGCDVGLSVAADDGGDLAVAGGDGGVTPDPLNADPRCTSDSYFPGGEGANMEPGGTCAACHASKARNKPAIQYQFAGTVFATGHEPDGCYGATNGSYSIADVRVIITDANGVDHPVAVRAPSGNFSLPATPKLATPYTARVTYKGVERVMNTPQTDGDCNGCHTQSGDNKAPGRITIPLVP